MDVWALALLLVESFIYAPFLRTDRSNAIEKLQSSEPVHLPVQLIADPQAVHVLTDMLRKASHQRIDITAVLVSE